MPTGQKQLKKMINRIIKDYLESLKEDKELDYIFPILLNSIGFRIISTPRNSKGQPQYGKDIVAIGKADNGTIYRWYFELKGNAAKDITDATFNARDGVRESILAAKDVPYEDSSIPSFDKLPWKIIFVHTGVLNEGTRIQFDNFIKREFPNGGFERWDIEKLTELFSEYLFNEYLLCDLESHKLLKKILVLLDAPGWNTNDLDRLIDIQLNLYSPKKKNKRLLHKCLSSINLLLAIIYQYSQETNNLLPAKKSSDRIVLKTWAWILKNDYEKNSIIIKSFARIVNLHFEIYSAYFHKILPLTQFYKGFYMPQGLEAEQVCYPLRCYDCMNDFLYYITAYNMKFPEKKNMYIKDQLGTVINLLKNNPGFDIPLLDNHAITLQLLIKFIFQNDYTEKDAFEFQKFIVRLVSNIIIRKKRYDMFPELHGNRKRVALSIYKKSTDYQDSSSLFLMNLIEIVAWANQEYLYKCLRDCIIESGVNLQISYPIESDDLEIKLFEHKLYEEMSVQTNIKLPETISEFNKSFKKRYNPIKLKTNETSFDYLIILAHLHYQTDWFPDFLNLGYWEPIQEKKE